MGRMVKVLPICFPITRGLIKLVRTSAFKSPAVGFIGSGEFYSPLHHFP